MKTAQYDKQMPFVGNETHSNLMAALNKNPRVDSKAAVVRAGLNLLFGLDADEQIPDGLTEEEVVQIALERVLHTERFEVERKVATAPADVVAVPEAEPVG